MLRPLIALTFLATSAPAFAQASLQPAEPAEIASAVATCVAAARPGSVDSGVLTGQGWAKGEAADQDGKAIELPFDVYARKGAKVMITARNADGNGMCSVVARIDRMETAPRVADALSTQFKVKPFQADKEGILWFADRRIVQLAATGDRSKPGVRVSVMQQVEKAK